MKKISLNGCWQGECLGEKRTVAFRPCYGAESDSIEVSGYTVE